MGESYLALKALHIVGAVLFLGNIIVTGWWKAMADRTGNPVVIAFAQRQVTLTDWIFTAGGSTLLLVAALVNVRLHGIDIAATPWLRTGLALFALSGVIWVAVLIPIQVKQARLARDFAHGGAIPPQYWRLNRMWIFWGVVDTLLPLSVIYWMVFKPA